MRPLRWLEQQDAAQAGWVYISVPECGISGRAAVLAIEPCPPIAPGNGRVVTGTYRHASATTFDIYVDGNRLESIGTTGNHPFWSVDRQDFVPAQQLKQGERLRTLQGLAHVTSIVPRAGPERVYNIEVHGYSVYHVGSAGILVHNGNANTCHILGPRALKELRDAIFGKGSGRPLPSPRMAPFLPAALAPRT